MAHPEVSDVFRTLDLTGVFANAVLGGLIARREKLDPIGFATLAVLSGLGGGLIVMIDVFTAVHRPTIITHALANRVPTVFPWRFGATDGGLASYGVDVADLHRRAAAYVDRILKGTNPADLPVQQPTKFEMVINLKTAKALGIEISPTLLATADEVIE